MTPFAFGALAGAVLSQTTPTTQPPPAPPAAPASPPAGTNMQAAPASTAAPAQDGFKMPGASAPQTGTVATTGAPSGSTGASGQTGQSGQQPGGLGTLLLPMLLVIVFMFVMTSMSGRKEKKRREAMLGAIKRGDRIQTTGGIIGTIVDLDSSEMTLRVDESTNTRIRFSRAAIQGVVREGAGGAGGGGGGKDSGRAELEAKPNSQNAHAS